MNALRLIYRPEDEWHGELSAVVESDGFGGRGAAWFEIEQLREFCRLTGRYPIASGEEPLFSGGIFEEEGGALEQCYLCVRLSPHDRRGAILATITLATPVWDEEDAELRKSITTRFVVSYSDLAHFRTSFEAMLEGRANEARLEASPS